MSANFDTISNGINSIPVGSATDEFLSWVENKELTIPLLRYNGLINFGINTEHPIGKSALSTGARLLITLVALPAIAQIGALYNLIAGVAKVGLGIISHFKQVEQEKVKEEISSGLQHLMTAVYDFAMSYLAMIFGVAYALFPRSANFPFSLEHFHDWLYKGPIIPPAPPVDGQPPAPAPAVPLREPSKIKTLADWTVEGLFASVNPSQTQGQAQT